ncbi:MAG: bifunctional folylpolyglutamate synthase/dihydrofolate synthase [Alphaproteobacteria bacterium]|nr:bifunctional folylpolyglutamate synthase/dihydrofolate synthase [Alphaproteobacteria bacterium]
MAKSDQLLADLMLLHPRLIDLSLGRIETLLGKLGNPHNKLPPVVHIAGTNGKGSVAAHLCAILEAAGYKVHVYVSPHLVRFHERISLASPEGPSRPIAEDALVDVLTRAQSVNDGDDITQFEITTAAALLAFSETPADVLLLEVGLGGRLDATNVIAEPALSVITSISMDHADKLGDSLDQIAAEKAGIIKPDVTCVVSQQEDGPLDVIDQVAQDIGAPVVAWGRDFEAFEQRGRLIFQRNDQLLDLPMSALHGRHQVINAGTAIAAALELKAFNIPDTAIETGLRRVSWPGRMQQLANGPLVTRISSGSELWLDGGHNAAAGCVLAQTMADLDERSPKPMHLITGMLALKDAAAFLAPFRGLARHVMTVPIPGSHEASHAPEILAKAAQDVGLRADTSTSVEAALARLEHQFPGPKRILICGSLHLAGHVLALQQGVAPQAS